MHNVVIGQLHSVYVNSTGRKTQVCFDREAPNGTMIDGKFHNINAVSAGKLSQRIINKFARVQCMPHRSGLGWTLTLPSP